MSARVQSVSTNASTGTSVDVTLPSGTVAGDLLVAILTASAYSSGGYAVTGSFTELQAPVDLENPGFSAYYKIADASLISAGLVTFSHTDNQAIIGGLVRITGHLTSGFFDTATTATSSGTAVSPAAHTYNRVEDMVLVIGGSGAADSWSCTAGAGVTVTEKIDFPSTVGDDFSLTAQELTRSTDGGTGTITLTRSGSVLSMHGLAVLVKGQVLFSQADTTTVTDSISTPRIRLLNVSETVTLTDSIVALTQRVWSHISRAIAAWTHTDKDA